MEDIIKSFRESYRRDLNVIEVNDLPFALLTEVINQSVLRGATKVSVTFDGNVFCVKDNAAPIEYRLDSEVVLRPRSEGMASDQTRRLHRILGRQWDNSVYAKVCALCSRFTFITSQGEHLRSIDCRDGIAVACNESDLGIGDGNMVVMRAFVGADDIDKEFVDYVVEAISERFLHVSFKFQ